MSRTVYDDFAAAPTRAAKLRVLGRHWNELPVTHNLVPFFLGAMPPREPSKLRINLMDADEYAAFRALPDRLELWRGGSSPEHDYRGLCWCLTRRNAERYMRDACRRQTDPRRECRPTLIRGVFRNPWKSSDIFAVKIGKRGVTVIVHPHAWILAEQEVVK